MDRFYLHHASFGIVGAVLMLDVVLSGLASGFEVPAVLLAGVGGTMVLSALYAVLTTQPDDVARDRYHPWMDFLLAVLALGWIGVRLLA